MVSGLFSTARELPRLREISSVFVRHGLGVRRAGIATLLERAGQALQWGEASEVAHLEPQQRARLAFEQLGPTFVKLGQMLSTREDLLPPAWTTELARLHSHVAPAPFDDLLPQVAKSLARGWMRFDTSDGTPRPRRPSCSSIWPKGEHKLQNRLQNQYPEQGLSAWSGRRESNPRMQLGKLPFYH
jgi:hypothetical protein